MYTGKGNAKIEWIRRNKIIGKKGEGEGYWSDEKKEWRKENKQP